MAATYAARTPSRAPKAAWSTLAGQALHRALPPASGGQGDAGAKRPGGADAPAERPRLAPARLRSGHRPRGKHLSRRRGRVRRTEQIVLVGQVPMEGCTVKWARPDGRARRRNFPEAAQRVVEQDDSDQSQEANCGQTTSSPGAARNRMRLRQDQRSACWGAASTMSWMICGMLSRGVVAPDRICKRQQHEHQQYAELGIEPGHRRQGKCSCGSRRQELQGGSDHEGAVSILYGARASSPCTITTREPRRDQDDETHRPDLAQHDLRSASPA